MPRSILERKSKAEFSVTWYALEQDLREWAEASLTRALALDLDRLGSKRLRESIRRNEMDAWPYWEIWAMYVADALSEDNERNWL